MRRLFLLLPEDGIETLYKPAITLARQEDVDRLPRMNFQIMTLQVTDR